MITGNLLYYHAIYPFRSDFDCGIVHAPVDVDPYIMTNGKVLNKINLPEFALKNGIYADCQPNDVGWNIFSKKLRDIVDYYKSDKDALNWLDIEIRSETHGNRKYHILHFPKVFDVLDKRKTVYNSANGSVIKPFFRLDMVCSHKSVLGNFKMLTVKDLTYKNAFFCVRRIWLCLLPF